MECKNCGSANIKVGISWGVVYDANAVGLRYSKGIFGNTAQLCSDLCLECGEINRTYVSEKDLIAINHKYNVAKERSQR